MARNRQNFFHDEGNPPGIADFGIGKFLGRPRACHTFYNYSKDWTEADEDCFSLSSEGKRLRATSASGPGQVCFSNPRTRQLFIEKLRSYIVQDRIDFPDGNWPVLYDISANDNNAKCECSTCLAAKEKYQTYGGVVLEFINAIAKGIAGEYPDVKVQTFAYMFAQAPPTGIKAAPNVVIRLAQLGTEWGIGRRDSLRPLTHPNNLESLAQMRSWGEIATLSMWDYWIMYCGKGAAPSVNLFAIAENMRIYAEQGVWFVFAECEAPLQSSFHALRLWLGFRMMNLPQLDATAEIKRFMDAYYGQAANPIYEYMLLLQKANDAVAEPLGDLPIARRYDLSKDFFERGDELLSAAEAALADQAQQLWRVNRERLIFDKALLDLNRSHGWLTSEQQQQTIERYRKNHQDVADVFLSGSNVAAAQERVRNYLLGLQLAIPPLPHFAGMDVLADYCWPDFSIQHKSVLVDDSDAAGGKAQALKSNLSHNSALQFGYYDVDGKKFKLNVEISKELLPQDEKFHLYPVGKTDLTTKSYFWAHSSWNIQRELHELYDSSGLNNTVEIFASIKLQGPSYVAGTKSEDALLLDRLLVVQSPKYGSVGSGLALPPEIDKKRLAYDFAWHSFIKNSQKGTLEGKLLRVDDSTSTCALQITLPAAARKSVLQCGIYDKAAGLNVRKELTIEQGDPAYKLYSLGEVQIASDSKLWVNELSYWNLRLASCYHPETANRYEVLLSLKMMASKTENDPALFFLDRVILLYPKP